MPLKDNTRSIIAIAALSAIAACSIAARAQEATTRSVWAGVYTAAQADRGKVQFSVRCASCHGAELAGNEMAPPLVGATFLGNWTGTSVGDLFKRIQTSMPATAPGTLDRKTVTDLVAFLLMSNQFPAGTTELPPNEQVLAQIRIDATAPVK